MNLTTFVSNISNGANTTSYASISQILVITGLIATISIIGLFFHKIQNRAYEK